jgi:hypothetical protein
LESTLSPSSRELNKIGIASLRVISSSLPILRPRANLSRSLATNVHRLPGRDDERDFRPPWLYTMSRLLSYTMIPCKHSCHVIVSSELENKNLAAAIYGIFFHDFGEREHVFQPVRLPFHFCYHSHSFRTRLRSRAVGWPGTRPPSLRFHLRNRRSCRSLSIQHHRQVPQKSLDAVRGTTSLVHASSTFPGPSHMDLLKEDRIRHDRTD